MINLRRIFVEGFIKCRQNTLCISSSPIAKEISTMKYIDGMQEFYDKIAKEYYDKYKEVNESYSRLTNDNKSWDILSHKQEENDEYFLLYREKQKDCIISIIFEAFAVESLINWYGVKGLGAKQYKSHYEKLSIIDKYVIVPRVVTGKEFPKHKQAFKKLKELNSTRNNLVHSKAQEIDLLDGDLQGFINSMSSMIGNGKDSIFNIIDKVINTYDELHKTLMEMENSK